MRSMNGEEYYGNSLIVFMAFWYTVPNPAMKTSSCLYVL